MSIGTKSFRDNFQNSHNIKFKSIVSISNTTYVISLLTPPSELLSKSETFHACQRQQLQTRNEQRQQKRRIPRELLSRTANYKSEAHLLKLDIKVVQVLP